MAAPVNIGWVIRFPRSLASRSDNESSRYPVEFSMREDATVQFQVPLESPELEALTPSVGSWRISPSGPPMPLSQFSVFLFCLYPEHLFPPVHHESSLLRVSNHLEACNDTLSSLSFAFKHGARTVSPIGPSGKRSSSSPFSRVRGLTLWV